MFTHIQYIFTLTVLFTGLLFTLKRYFQSSVLRSEEFYLVLGIMFVFLNYIFQYIIILRNHFSFSLVNMAHMMKVYNFWLMNLFVMSQIHFKKVKIFRLYKVILFIIFLIVPSIALSISSYADINLYVSHYSLPLSQRISVIYNPTSEFLFEFLCFASSIVMLIFHNKVVLLNKLLLRVSLILSSITYFLSSFNALLYKGTNYILFNVFQSLGSIASFIMVLTIISYFFNTKNINETRRKYLDKWENRQII